MDDMTTGEVPWQRLDRLVPDEFDPYWQLTLRFLLIAREVWPGILAERGAIEPALRRDRLIAPEAARLASRVGKPVIAAGFAGAPPAKARIPPPLSRPNHWPLVVPRPAPRSSDEESVEP